MEEIIHPIYLGTMGENQYNDMLHKYKSHTGINIRQRTHYSMYGEWGSTKVNCGRYFTTDVMHTDDKHKVTCKNCLKQLT